MRYSITLLIILISLNNLFSQERSLYDSNNNYHISKMDFKKVDSLDLWNFCLDTNYTSSIHDSIAPIGKITFWRTKSIDDGISKGVYGRLWTPYIEFEIFELKDSLYCGKQSNRTYTFSSCVPPDVGGDIITVGDYIFLNTDVCLECGRYDTGFDYCRPVLKKVFEKVDLTKNNSLAEIVMQFPIKEGVMNRQ